MSRAKLLVELARDVYNKAISGENHAVFYDSSNERCDNQLPIESNLPINENNNYASGSSSTQYNGSKPSQISNYKSVDEECLFSDNSSTTSSLYIPPSVFLPSDDSDVDNLLAKPSTIINNNLSNIDFTGTLNNSKQVLKSIENRPTENDLISKASLNSNDTSFEEECSFSNNSLSSIYIPSSDYTSSEDSEVDNILANPTNTWQTTDYTNTLNNLNQNLGTNRNESTENYLTSKVSPELKTLADKVLCPFCFEDVGHFSRHLTRKHADEETVKKIISMPSNSSDRRDAIIALRKRGNFIITNEKNKIKPVRKPSKYSNLEKENILKNNENYFPCVNCLGYYKKSYLWRHRKICKSNLSQKNKNDSGRPKHLTEAQTFLAVSGLLGNFLNKSRLKNEVFNIMRPDNISFIAKCDSLICLYGESYLNKHKRRQMNVVVSNKMRELARLKIALQGSTNIVNLIDALKPDMYNHILAASKIISGYDPEKKTFKASSLALHLGTSLKFLCDIARKAIIIKDPLFANLNRTEAQQNILELREMINVHWCNDISSLANKALNEKKWQKPKLLPLTEDVLVFNNYVTKMAEQAFEKLEKNEDVVHNYKILMECTLAIVLIFNRKRIGEVQFLDISSYKRDYQAVNQEECLNTLSELEKAMSVTFKRVVVSGKGSKPVPLLFTTKMQKFIATILKIRSTTDIVSKKNTYVFANPGSGDRWVSGSSVIRKFANNCGAKNPELLTSTRFRKQIATILQLMNFESDEMEQVARFMGHTEKTHREFYRLSEDVYQTAKVAKVLLLLNSGKGSELKGKSLANIEITEDVLLEDEVLDFDEDNRTIETENVNEAEIEIVSHSSKANENELDVQEYLSRKNIRNIKTTEQKSNDKEHNKKINTRVKWIESDKKKVLNYFKKHVQKRNAPKKSECLEFINQNTNAFKEHDWLRIKTLVYNTYRQN